MKAFLKSKKNVLLLILTLSLSVSVVCNIYLATRKPIPKEPPGMHKQLERFDKSNDFSNAKPPANNTEP